MGSYGKCQGPQEHPPSLVEEKEGGSGGACETPGRVPEPGFRDPRLAWHAAGTLTGSSRQGPRKVLHWPPARVSTQLGARRESGCRFPGASVLPAVATPACQRWVACHQLRQRSLQ